MSEALVPGQVIGILGGGQLGRMLAMAAARLGFKVHVFEPGANPPAGDMAAKTFTAPYDDTEALIAFAKGVDVVTFEYLASFPNTYTFRGITSPVTDLFFTCRVESLDDIRPQDGHGMLTFLILIMMEMKICIALPV